MEIGGYFEGYSGKERFVGMLHGLRLNGWGIFRRVTPPPPCKYCTQEITSLL